MFLEQKIITVSLPSLGLSSVEMAASIRYPDVGIVDGCTVLVCWPGGSYSRSYWDFPSETYSFSRYMAERGYVVVNVDPLGVGASTRPPDADDVGLAVMAEAAAGCADQIRIMLAEGTLDQGLGPVGGARLVGVGHSMGGALVTATQALFGSYDAIAILGFPVRIRDTSADGDTMSMSVTELIQSPAADRAKAGSGPTWEDKYVMLDRTARRSVFHLPDVPLSVIEADDALSVTWPRRPNIEAAAGFDAMYAPRVSVPIFLGFGSVELVADPRTEVPNYPSCNDITLQILKRSAHCHNFSTDRHLMWDRIDRWL